MRFLRRSIIIIMLIMVLAIRFVPYGGEIYATCVYPYTSWILSFISSFVPFSLEEIIVILFLLMLILYPVLCKAFGRRMSRCITGEIEMLALFILWFYLGWGCNYFRTGFYERMMIESRENTDKEFSRFLSIFTRELNGSYTEMEGLDKAHTEYVIKKGFSALPSGYGLCSPQDFQKPKKQLLSALYPYAGVMGFMGPFMAESHICNNVPDDLYPSVFAHELSHLLGISEEAEANFWAYLVCTRAEDPRIRYSGYLGLLKYVMYQTYANLGEEGYENWKRTVDKRILERYEQIYRDIEDAKSPVPDWFQNHLFNLFLKSNNVKGGTRNYIQVISMILSYDRKERRPQRYIRQSIKQ